MMQHGLRAWQVLRLVFLGLVCSQLAFAENNSELISIASQNLHRLFDDKDDPLLREKIQDTKSYQASLKKIADHFKYAFKCPDILLLQEVENKQVLEDLSNKTCVGIKSYRVILEEGFDASGIDVGALVASNIHLSGWQQLARTQRLGKSQLPLFTRPPLMIRFLPHPEAAVSMTVLVVHLRSMVGLQGKNHQRIAYKRRKQAEWLAAWLKQQLQENSQAYLIIAGDFNAVDNDQDPENTLAIIKNSQSFGELKASQLKNLNKLLPEAQGYTYIYQGKKQALDHMLVSPAIWPLVNSYKVIDVLNAQSLSKTLPQPIAQLPLLDHNGLLLELKIPQHNSLPDSP